VSRWASPLIVGGVRNRRPQELPQYFITSRGHGQEFITVPDTAGMWWLVPILGEAS